MRDERGVHGTYNIALQLDSPTQRPMSSYVVARMDEDLPL